MAAAASGHLQRALRPCGGTEGEAQIRSSLAKIYARARSGLVLALAAGCIDRGRPQDSAAERDVDSDSAARLLSPLIERTVTEGDTVTLRTGMPPEELQAATTLWVQTSGPAVELHGASAPLASFVAPEVDEDLVLVFQFILLMDGQSALQQTVVHVADLTVKSVEPSCGAAGCGAGWRCNPVTGACEPVDPCQGMACGTGRICDQTTGVCVQAEACGDAVCEPDERCNPDTALCEPACPGVSCVTGERLDRDTCTCEAADPCAGVTCPAGAQCTADTGQCEPEDLCADVSCGTGEVCDSLTGACVQQDLCSGVSCPAGSQCDPETGECAEHPCSEPEAGNVFVVADSSVGSLEFALVPDFWLEFDRAVDPATFDPAGVEVMQAGPDNVWGTSDDVVLATTAQHDGNRRLTVLLAPESGELIGGRYYRVSLSPGCLRATGGGGTKLGLDGEFDGAFPSGDGIVGGTFVQEFLGVAPATYASQSLCHEQSRDILGRVTNEDVHYDDSVVVTGDGDLLYAGRPIRPGETMSPEGYDITMTVRSVSLEGASWHTLYDVVGTKDGYAFDGPQDESYTFNDDGTITHAGTSAFTVRSNRGVAVAEFNRTCNATLRR